MGERAATGDVADAVEPVDTDHPHLIVHVERAGLGIEADGVQGDVRQVRSAADRDQQLLSRDRAAVASVTSTPSPPAATAVAETPMCRSMPSRRKTSASNSDARGSSR